MSLASAVVKGDMQKLQWLTPDNQKKLRTSAQCPKH